MTRLAAAALLVAAACGSAATGAAPSPTATGGHHAASPAATPINVDDMMGGSFSPATVFALAGSELLAVRLQNHFVPYRIPVADEPRALVGPDASRLYVVDRSAGATRIRAFEPATGVEMAAGLSVVVPAGRNALAQDGPDRLLALVDAGSGVRVEAIGTSPFADLGAVSTAECGDRLLASASRIAVVCSSTGTVWLDPLAGRRAALSVPGAPVVAATMLSDGTMVLGTAAGGLHVIARGAATLTSGPALSPSSVLPDGIAASGDELVVMTGSADGSVATAYHGAFGVRSGTYPLRVRPASVVALWPYAYFSSDDGLYHVDLRNGLVERMVALDRPRPLAVAPR